MKFRLTIIFVLINFLSASSQTDKKADEILKGVSAKYKSFRSLKATFSILIENVQQKTKQIQKGTIFLKGEKYKLLVADQDIFSDGKTRWTYLKDANEVQIDNQKNDINTISPTNIFTIYEKGWLSKYTGEQKDKAGSSHLIELVPNEAKSENVFKVKLTINRTQKMISSAKIFEKNGDIQTITVDKLFPNGADNDSLYVFDIHRYPGSEVVDLR